MMARERTARARACTEAPRDIDDHIAKQHKDKDTPRCHGETRCAVRKGVSIHCLAAAGAALTEHSRAELASRSVLHTVLQLSQW
jgi:hypothetical protein